MAVAQRVILGIDTGGTYTDAVLLDAASGAVRGSAKRLTTHGRLEDGICAALAAIFPEARGEVCSVHLSTTLATNAAVENRTARCALLFLGQKPEGRFPVQRQILLHGRMDIKGYEVEPVDAQEVTRAAQALRGEVEAVAVSGFASVRNPAHERRVRELLQAELEVPVVCAHELTAELGFYERSVTAALNAGLIPSVTAFLRAIRAALARFGIDAPLMIVRSDGTLSSAESAMRRPVDTILSGPAASAIGAARLCGLRDCLAVDMGGTTTDVIHVENGRLELLQSGAQIGHWQTAVRAAAIHTAGVGGDSRIRWQQGRFQIGPERCVPISRAAAQRPEVLKGLRALQERGGADFQFQDYELYVAELWPPEAEAERALWAQLQTPKTLHALFRAGLGPELPTRLEGLVRRGCVQRIALTPTDLLHAAGELDTGDAEASELALEVAAEAAGLTREAFLDGAREAVLRNIGCAILRAALYFQQPELSRALTACGAAESLLWPAQAQPLLETRGQLKLRVAAAGAPAERWVAEAARRLGAEVCVASHAEVANAVGAAASAMTERLEVLIRQDAVTGAYFVYSPFSRLECASLEEATTRAEAAGRIFLDDRTRCGAKITSSVQDLRMADGGLLERSVCLTAEQTKNAPEQA